MAFGPAAIALATAVLIAGCSKEAQRPAERQETIVPVGAVAAQRAAIRAVIHVSGVVVPGTGIALHNRGAGFTLTPGLPNTAAPGKRPFHTLVPAFMRLAGEANWWAPKPLKRLYDRYGISETEDVPEPVRELERA